MLGWAGQAVAAVPPCCAKGSFAVSGCKGSADRQRSLTAHWLQVLARTLAVLPRTLQVEEEAAAQLAMLRSQAADEATAQHAQRHAAALAELQAQHARELEAQLTEHEAQVCLLLAVGKLCILAIGCSARRRHGQHGLAVYAFHAPGCAFCLLRVAYPPPRFKPGIFNPTICQSPFLSQQQRRNANIASHACHVQLAALRGEYERQLEGAELRHLAELEEAQLSGSMVFGEVGGYCSTVFEELGGFVCVGAKATFGCCRPASAMQHCWLPATEWGGLCAF